MGSFVARQPNGLLCRWSSIVDNITHFNMTEEQYIEFRAERERKQARIEMENHSFVKPFSEILSKRDKELILQCVGVIENEEEYTREEVQIAKDEIKRLQSEFDECVKIMSEPVKEDMANICKTDERTFFIAKCGDKYLSEWYDPITSDYIYLWGIVPGKFHTREGILEAIGQSVNPDSTVIIKEMKDTVITEVVSEECCSVNC